MAHYTYNSRDSIEERWLWLVKCRLFAAFFKVQLTFLSPHLVPFGTIPGSGMSKPTSSMAPLHCRRCVPFTFTNASGMVYASASFQNISFSLRWTQWSIPHITFLLKRKPRSNRKMAKCLTHWSLHFKTTCSPIQTWSCKLKVVLKRWDVYFYHWWQHQPKMVLMHQGSLYRDSIQCSLVI